MKKEKEIKKESKAVKLITPEICQICGKRFKDKRALNGHYVIAHNRRNPSQKQIIDYLHMLLNMNIDFTPEIKTGLHNMIHRRLNLKELKDAEITIAEVVEE